MTAKELKRLRRSDLLEMMLTLRKENELLRQQLEQAQVQLAEQKAEIESMESMSDVSQRLSKMLETVKVLCEHCTKQTDEKNVEVYLQQEEPPNKRSGLVVVANNGVKKDRCLKNQSQKKCLPLKFWKKN